jgi:hypothetical protein
LKGEKMKAYKGFNEDLTCRGYQYEEGANFETDRAECCETGFHACEYPLDVFSYYSPNESIFHEVELEGEIDKSNKDSKVSATKIKIGARISISGLVKAAIDYTLARINPEASSSEKRGASSATGTCGASSATGDYGASSATGTCGASSATGDYGASSATGTCGASSATGDYGASSATGTCGASSATGTCGASSATGYKGASSAQDPTGVAVGWGYEAKAKGCKGATIVLADWRYIGPRGEDGRYYEPYCKENWEFHGAKLIVVDGEDIKANTYYSYINGNLTEVAE